MNIDKIDRIKDVFINTDFISCYQELFNFINEFRLALMKVFIDYDFSKKVTENRLDYAYFQFYNKSLKEKGLKYVITFDYKSFSFYFWLSGINKGVQNSYFSLAKEKYRENCTKNPLKSDYLLFFILKNENFCLDILIERVLLVEKELRNFLNSL